MKCSRTSKYVNQQTYLDTVCKASTPKKKEGCACKNYAECSCGDENGCVTFRIDESATKLSICVNNKKGQK